jgi:hypothetical protein
MLKRQRLKTFGSDETITAIQGQVFFARHGPPGTQDLSEGESDGGHHGWWEMAAADGYRLRCDWVRTDDEEQLAFSEIAPGSEH